MPNVKSLDLNLSLKSNNKDLYIKLNGQQHSLKENNIFPLTIKSINENIQIEFGGFTHEDPKQEVQIDLFYKNKKLDTKKISTFQMIGIKYVENKKLENYDNIFFNGILSLQFSHNWIEIEIISGFNLLKDKNFFIDITLGDYEQRKKFEEKIQQDKNKMHYVALVGTCHLLDKNKKFAPSIFSALSKEYPDKSIINYSCDGHNDWSVLHNSFWLLKNFQIKNLIITLNINTNITSKTRIFDHICYTPFMYAPSEKQFLYESQIKLYRFNRKRMSLWSNIVNKKLDQLLLLCKELKVTPIILNFGVSKLIKNDRDEYIDYWREQKNANLKFGNNKIDYFKRNEITNSNIIQKLKSHFK